MKWGKQQEGNSQTCDGVWIGSSILCSIGQESPKATNHTSHYVGGDQCCKIYEQSASPRGRHPTELQRNRESVCMCVSECVRVCDRKRRERDRSREILSWRKEKEREDGRPRISCAAAARTSLSCRNSSRACTATWTLRCTASWYVWWVASESVMTSTFHWGSGTRTLHTSLPGPSCHHHSLQPEQQQWGRGPVLRIQPERTDPH